jgi:ADP-heptose:LPS heptosyltransferase
VVVGGSFAEIIVNNPYVGNCFVYTQKKFLKNPLLFFKFLFDLQKQRYDLVIDCKKVFSFNNALLTLWANSSFKIGFKNELAEFYLSKFYSYECIENYHESQFLALPLISEFKLDLQDLPFMEFYYAKDYKIDKSFKDYIAIHIGGRGSKTIESHLVNKIAESLPDEQILIIYGPDEIEKIKEISNLINIRKIFPENISNLAACIQNAKLFITPDTGPLHIASALNQNIAALFAVTSSNLYGPRTSGKCLTILTADLKPEQIIQELTLFLTKV